MHLCNSSSYFGEEDFFELCDLQSWLETGKFPPLCLPSQGVFERINRLLQLALDCGVENAIFYERLMQKMEVEQFHIDLLTQLFDDLLLLFIMITDLKLEISALDGTHSALDSLRNEVTQNDFLLTTRDRRKVQKIMTICQVH